MRQIAVFVISILGSALVLWYVLRDVAISEVASNMSNASPVWLGIALLLIILALWTRGVRWRGLVDNRVTVTEAFWIFGITMMFNLLPLRAGEVARSLIATRRGIPIMTAAASIVVERLLDTFIVVILVLISISQLPEVPPEVAQSTQLFAVLGTIGFATLIFFARFPHIAHGIREQVEKLIPPLQKLPLENLLNTVLDGLSSLTHWRGFLHAVVWTVIAWLASIAAMVAIYFSLDLQQSMVILASMMAISVASFGIAIPVTIAGAGPFQAALLVTGNTLLDMPEAQSLALGFITQGITIAGYFIVGVTGLFRLGVSLGDVFGRGEKPEPQPES